ncbi:MAG TPA: hypothetical protein VLB68_10320 [Pyrinomonadaceae bacterium]|nr:hypothetical protein [Pyrinomonadaceae bacterium]
MRGFFVKLRGWVAEARRSMLQHLMETFDQPKRFPKVLTVIWWFVYLPLVALEARLLYEQTWLTYTRGEQMIGFSIAHQFPELLLFGLAGWLGSILWCIVALLFILRRRYQISTISKLQFALALTTLLLTFMPVDRLVLKLR